MTFLLADDPEHLNPTTSGVDPLDGIEPDEETVKYIKSLLGKEDEEDSDK